MQYANNRHIAASGHNMHTTHHGGRYPAGAAFRVLPQYQRAATQSCWAPCTIQARIAQTSVAAPYGPVRTHTRGEIRQGLTASSPKLRPKNVNAAADATAYDQVASADSILCEGMKTSEIEGRPIKKKAMAKKNHGAERIQTDGLSLNRAYQIPEATKKIPPKTYSCHASCQFCPDSKVIWKLVAQNIFGEYALENVRQ